MNFCHVSRFTQGGVDCYASINIRITHFYKQCPDYGADNPTDFYGYTDIEWEVESVDVFLEDTGDFLYNDDTATQNDLEYYGTSEEEIEKWLLEQIEDMAYWEDK